MSDFKKAINMLLKIGKPLFSPTKLPLPPVRPNNLPPPALVRRGLPPLRRAPVSPHIKTPKQPKTIKFDESGKPIIPKQYLNESGLPKDPKQLKAQVLKDYKQHLLNQKALLDRSINIAKTQAQLKTSIERALLLEKITSTKTKVALSIVGGLAFLSFALSGQKPSSDNKTISTVLSGVEKSDLLTAQELKEKLSLINSDDEQVKLKTKELINIFNILSNNSVNLSNSESAKKYAKAIAYLDSKINEYIYLLATKNIQSEVVEDLKKYLYAIQNARGLSA